MSNDPSAPRTPGGASDAEITEERLRRPMGGFSPSSPDYRPLPPLPPLDGPPGAIPSPNPPDAQARSTRGDVPAQPTSPSTAVPPPGMTARVGAPSATRRPLDPPTLPDGVPTPGRIPAYSRASRAYGRVPAAPHYGPPNVTAATAVPPPAPPSRPVAPPVPPVLPRSQAYPPPPYAPARRSDLTPVVVEAVSAVFGIYGLGWMMVGRTGTGLLLALAGLIWDGIAFVVSLTGIGICCTLPLHAVFITLSAVSLSNYIKRHPSVG